MNYFEVILIVAVVLLGFLVWKLWTERKNAGKEAPELIKRQAQEKEENKQKILKFLDDKDRIANDEIERLLGVSNATAERYLDELEKAGALKQVGRTGRSVFYERA